MKCDELLKLLNDYVDGDVDPALCKELEKHLGACDPCRIVVDDIRKTISLYQDGQIYELPPDFRSRLETVLKDKWKSRPNASGGPSSTP